VRGSAGLTGAGESELASGAGHGPCAREGAGLAEREGRRARAGLSANGPSADRAEEKGGERSGPREEGVWAGLKRGLGREIEFWAGLGFLFPILSSFLFAI